MLSGWLTFLNSNQPLVLQTKIIKNGCDLCLRGFLSSMFDERFKNCSYTVDGEKHYFRCKLFVKTELNKEEMSKLVNILNVRVYQFKDFLRFYLRKERIFENEDKQTNYLYVFESIQKFFLKPVVKINTKIKLSNSCF